MPQELLIQGGDALCGDKMDMDLAAGGKEMGGDMFSDLLEERPVELSGSEAAEDFDGQGVQRSSEGSRCTVAVRIS